MAKEATVIHFDFEGRERIQSYADFRGISFSEAVREALLEKVEDAADIEAYRAALAEDGGTRCTTDEVIRMALMAE